MSENKNVKDKTKDLLNDVKDDSKKFDKKDVESGKGLAILSYIIPIIPYFVEKKNEYVKYHANQGMNLLMVAIAYSVLNAILTSLIKVKGDCGFGYWGDLANDFGVVCEVTPWWVTVPLGVIGLGISVLCIIGIVYACQGKAKELPLLNKVKIFNYVPSKEK